ncbi:hypothetical protein [Rothia nasimurium]|uniref:hypothetical protein n=1 Tax=Rothia nasimurium TaxID=85336 RepID=UPI002DD62990|nr:hypothetical protein [Rothia nasimurium]
MMSQKTWLYIYENAQLNSIYIGIAGSIERVFQAHNSAAEELRDSKDTAILQTIEPFSTRADARKAEAIAIRVAAMAGRKVTCENEEGEFMKYTNISGVDSTKEIGPAVFTKPGEFDISNTRGAVLVAITASEMDDRVAPSGWQSGAVFSERARKWWSMAKEKREGTTHLIAVLKDSGNRILGSWEIDPEGNGKPWRMVGLPCLLKTLQQMIIWVLRVRC